MIAYVGVIGAGQMGNGIAHVCAVAGYQVKLVDLSQEQLDKGLEAIRANLARQHKKGLIEEKDINDVLARIATSTISEFPECDVVIEAATEDEAVKQKIFSAVCPTLKPKAILCTNTSSISVTRLGANTDRPGRFMGMHFMNPVPVMKLVELIRGIATEEDTFRQVYELTEKIGKTPISAEDFPAFIVNRILLPMINEAVYTLHEGVGSVTSIDNAMRLGANHPMGPLELADFIGLDTCLSIMRIVYEGLGDTKYRPCPLLVKYVEAGWLGRKTGRGFYDYSGDTPQPTR